MANDQSSEARAISTSEATTRNVNVAVEARYSPDHSDPARREWFFLYSVRITNSGTETVRLVSRHWIITDASGNIEEVRGPGVVGHRPVLTPGESFEYTSGCPLRVPFGSMRGTYQMVTEGGVHFDAEIAPFALSEPGSIE